MEFHIQVKRVKKMAGNPKKTINKLHNVLALFYK